MRDRKHHRNEVEDLPALQQMLDGGADMTDHAVQGVDLTGIEDFGRADLKECIFIGCRFASPEQEQRLRERGAIIFPRIGGLPYDTYRTELYTVGELNEGYRDGGYVATRDFAIYAHCHRERHHPGGISIRQALAQRLHDHAIDDALMEFLECNSGEGVVGVMGGHGTPRSDEYYAKVARITRALTREGYLVVSGGGPGVMEAANLGAWLAPHDEPDVIDRAIGVLRQADTFSGGHREGTREYMDGIEAHIRRAQQVVDELTPPAGSPGVSLAVPTWFYGHEPSNLFSSRIAKYFDNSIREEGLLAIARAGVIYAPGSAGTMQEMFQDLTQNHYATYRQRSPMIMLGRRRYEAEHRMIKDFVSTRNMNEIYGDLVTLQDDVDDVVAFIKAHPPRDAPSTPPLYELI